MRGGEPLILATHGGPLRGVRFAHDGSRLLTWSSDRTARVYDLEGRERAALRGHAAAVTAAAFSPDDARVITASADETARVWRADGEGEALALAPAAGQVLAAAFTDDSAQALVMTAGGGLRRWTPGGAARVVAAFAPLNAASFAADGSSVAAAQQGEALVMVAPAGRGAPRTVQRGAHGVVGVAVSPRGDRVLSWDTSGGVHLARVDGGAAPISLALPAAASTATFDADGERVAVALGDGSVVVAAVGWRALLDVLRRATGACLTVNQRVIHLGELRADATARHGECEHAHGRGVPH